MNLYHRFALVAMFGQTFGLLTKHPYNRAAFCQYLVQPTFLTASKSSRAPLPCTDLWASRKQGVIRTYSTSGDQAETTEAPFQRGMKVIIEVMSFGPMGASVDVVAANSHDPDDVIQESEEALGAGLISQQEIRYFRSSRNGLDVVLGEILRAYVTDVRDDGKLAIGLRPFGGKEKATELGAMIIERLETDGEVPVGDKSPPNEIERVFPGASKSAFKKAVAALYKERKVKPGPFSVSPYDEKSS